MIKKEQTPHNQLFSIIKINKLMGNERINAVKKESWRGDMFLAENILQDKGYVLGVTSYELRVMSYGLLVIKVGINWH